MEDIIYEQPLNEQIRLCLRLEYLFEQANHYINGESMWDSHQMLKIIIEIMQASDRPDIKNRFCQILNQYACILNQLTKLQNIDQDKLKDTLGQIDRLIDILRINQKKAGQELREDDFLNSIQQRLYTPAGTCCFSLPSYHLWLHQPNSLQRKQLKEWLGHFTQLEETISLILKLVREGTAFKEENAAGGFYKANLDPNTSYQMIRTKIPLEKNLYPEISVGRYRLAIHFFTINITGRAIQHPNDVSFELACCKM